MRNKPRKLLFGVLYIFIIITAIVGILIYINRVRVVQFITVEAGTAVPAAKLFIENGANEASYITDITAIPVDKIGRHEVELDVKGKVYPATLEIVDTIAPTAVVRSVDIAEPENVEPERFVESIEDATAVTVRYKQTPDFSKLNKQTVTIVLTDAAGNQTEYHTELIISKLKQSVRVEASREGLELRKLLKAGYESATVKWVSDPPNLEKLGTFPIQVSVDGQTYTTAIEVVDTRAPVVTAAEQTAWVGESINAAAFITEVDDISTVKVRYETQPDFSRAGEQSVRLVITDEGNNETIVTSKLILEDDVEPPKIYGAKTSTIYIGETVSYKKGVIAEDNKDGEIPFTVDSSQVNLKVEGLYKVIYTAIDSSGNKATQEVEINVKKQSVTMEQLEVLADEVLAQITTDDMTLREKAWEIYEYVNKHLTYTGYSDKTDWMKEAHSGITKAVGDCFTYYSMSHLLLNRIGMETLSVERASKPGEARHYWHLVNYGEGWYHFDACIHRPPLVSFMLTDAEMDAYSKRVGKDNYYYRFDKENYPRTPEK